MAEENIKVPVETLVDFTIEALTAMGTSEEDARIIADVIITSDLWGVRSHGIAHLRMYHERIKNGLQLTTTNWQVVKDAQATAVIDGGNGMGMVVGYHAMKLAIEKVRQYGLGAVAVRNSSHYGVAGYYPLMAVKEGMVGLSVTNAHPSTAPTFSIATNAPVSRRKSTCGGICLPPRLDALWTSLCSTMRRLSLPGASFAVSRCSVRTERPTTGIVATSS